MKKNTCSQTFFYILNREFDQHKALEERASDVLAGGIMQSGHQCGMLWGASLAVGAEAYRQCENVNQSIAVAIQATKHIMQSFVEREETINCREITNCNFKNKLSFAKYMLSGRFLHCFNLAQHWAPEAVQSAKEGLTNQPENTPHRCVSCASEVAKKMGASEEEMVMVSGFSGGLGLSGAACGALAAAIWLKSIQWCKENAKKSPITNPYSQETLAAFDAQTNSERLCSIITDRTFNSIEEHSDYIENGGCEQLMETLANS